MRWVYGGGMAIILATFLADVWLPVDYMLAANWSLVCLAVFVTAFTVLYGWRSNWRSNRVGVALLTKSVFLSTVLWQIVVSVWWSSEYPFRQQIRFVIYAFGALAYITMLVSLHREQNRDRTDRGLF